jgi:FkbM family methyltransferase
VFKVEERLAPQRLARERVVEIDKATRLSLRLSDLIDRTIYLNGFSDVVVAVFAELATRSSVVVDVGANVGEYTTVAAARARNGGVVLAFEPNPPVYKRLLTNIALNDIGNVQAFENALSNLDGPAKLNIPLDQPGFDEGWATLTEMAPGRTTRQVEVAQRRLDSVLEELNLAPVDLIKVDVEGAEEEVLEGSSRTLQAGRPAVLVELHHVDVEADRAQSRVADLLRGHGYEIFRIHLAGTKGWGLSLAAGGEDLRISPEQTTPFHLVGIHPATEFARIRDERRTDDRHEVSTLG